MAVLSFDHVNKIYPGGFQAVRDFQLEIARARMCCSDGSVGLWKVYGAADGVGTGACHVRNGEAERTGDQ